MDLALALLAILATTPAASDPAPLVVELASPAPQGSAMPSPTALPDGRVALAWTERGATHHSGVLRMALLADERWSAPVEIARGDDWFVNWADFPALGALAGGGLVAHWLRKSASSTYAYDVLLCASRDDGKSWSAPLVLHTDRSPAEHGFVSFAPLGERLAAIWLDGRNASHDDAGGATGLFFRTLALSDGGLELGDEVCLDERVCDCCPTAMVAEADGLACVYRDRSSGEVRDVSIVRLEQGVWSKPSDVHADGWRIEGCPVNGPRLAAHAGRLAAAWYTGAGGGGGRVQVAFAASGARAFGAPVRVDDGATSGRVDAAFLDDGALVVTWLEHVEGEAEWRVRFVWSDGRRSASTRVAGVGSDRSGGILRLASDGARALAAWTATGTPQRVATALIRPAARQ